MGKDRLPHTVGSKPNTVRVYRRRGRSSIYIRCWNPRRKCWDKRSLKHNDVDKAKAEAAELHAKLVAGDKARREGTTTIARLFSLYGKHRSPQKGIQEQKADARRMKMWTRFLGASKDAAKVRREEWENFIAQRSSGGIDACGRPEGHEAHRETGPVGMRTVEADLRFLLAVLHWGATWQTTDDTYLLSENVCRGYPVPKEKNPSRPVATDARVQAVRSVAAQVTMEVAWGEKRKTVSSHLPALFDLAVETGRRLSSILALRQSDLLLDRGPHGFIRWRADADKEGMESIVPISPRAREALGRHAARMRELGLPGIGDAPLFAAPEDPASPVDRHLADRWLRRAEKLAELEPHKGSQWHAYRRRWATVRKHLPATDVAKAGGWAGPETLQACYQQPDEQTMYQVVVSGGELREAQE
jgi:integrase